MAKISNVLPLLCYICNCMIGNSYGYVVYLDDYETTSPTEPDYYEIELIPDDTNDMKDTGDLYSTVPANQVPRYQKYYEPTTPVEPLPYKPIPSTKLPYKPIPSAKLPYKPISSTKLPPKPVPSKPTPSEPLPSKPIFTPIPSTPTSPSSTSDLFMTGPARQVPRFQKYFTSGELQPLDGLDHDHEGHEELAHAALDTSECPTHFNIRDRYLVSTLNAPNCPMMNYDDANNFCLKLGLKAVSVKSTLNMMDKDDLFNFANVKSFWTDGFILDPMDETVYWDNEGEPIIPELWAEGQPDGPVAGDVERCVAVRKSTNNSGRLHDRRCAEKMAVVCEEQRPDILQPMPDFMQPTSDFMQPISDSMQPMSDSMLPMMPHFIMN